MNKKISIYSKGNRAYIPRAYGDFLRLERFNNVECVTDTDGKQVALVFSYGVFKSDKNSVLRGPKSEKDGYSFSSAAFAEIVRLSAKGSPYEGENIKISPEQEKAEGNSLILFFKIAGDCEITSDSEEMKDGNVTGEIPPVPAPVDVKARAAIRLLTVELKKSGVLDGQQVKGIIGTLAD